MSKPVFSRRWRPAVLIGALFVGLGFGAAAGELNAPAGSDDPASAQFTLMDLWSRLSDGTPGELRAGAFVPPATGPTVGTMYSLNEIMAIMPALDPDDGATAAQVLAGQTFWGLRADGWGLLTGTMETRTLSDSTTAVAAGYYAATDLVTVDADLVGGNIASGKDIFGVAGTAVVATGDAVAAEVLTGKTFSNASGAGLSGSMVNVGQQDITPGTSAQTITQGYHDGTGTVAGDTDLTADNIKKDTVIFGVTGTYEGGGAPAPVEKTGQTPTVPLNPGPAGSDGALQKGVAWPNPRFTNNFNGTVTDNLTGLIWLRNANCFGFRNWTTALTDANTLANGSCGLTDGSTAGQWRLPNIKELQSLVHYGIFNPALPNAAGTGQWTANDPFSGVQPSTYWSSTSHADDTSNAWVLTLYYGFVRVTVKTDTNSVWPVRGGQ